MDALDLQHPAWTHTFPHRVTPKPGESLVSLLLRCDLENHWASGTSCRWLLRALLPKGSVRVNRANLFLPPQQLIALLAQRLALPFDALVATTFLREHLRFFGTMAPSLGDLCFWSGFHLCPLCIQEQRLLLRSQFLFGRRCCLHHQVLLLPSCACGTLLKPFHLTTTPFTCSACLQPWGTLPTLSVAPEELDQEHQILACYEWWFKHGDAALMKTVLLQLAALDTRKRPTPRSRWSSFSVREARRRFLAGSSHLGSLSGLVGHLDELGLLSRFSLEPGETDLIHPDACQQEGAHLESD
jgi:hypothetical protein